MHELAEQWKQFGTNSIHKLECQIIDYQEKLNELEQRQINLIKENESLKSLINQMMIKTSLNENHSKDVKQNISTQTNFEKKGSSHHSCFHRPKPIDTHLTVQPKIPVQNVTRQMSIDDPLQQQISMQNMSDAIKVNTVQLSLFSSKSFFVS
jgi:hypothetical protein